MMLLDLKKINTLGDQFRKYPHGVEKTDFIRLIKQEIGFNPNDLMDETNLVYGLYKFFCEIDFNGDGHMQWEEFTQFIIDTVEGENQTKGADNNNERAKSNNVVSERNIHKYKRYEISSKLKDFYIHKTDVITAAYMQRNEKMLLSEYNSKKVRVYNARTARIESVLDIEKAFKEYEQHQLMLKQQHERKYNNHSGITNNGMNNVHSSNSMKHNFRSKSYNNNTKRNNTRNQLEAFLQQTKAKNNNDTNNAFTVISITASPYIIAVCLSNSVILFFNFSLKSKNELLYKIKTPSLQKRVWYLNDHNVWFSSGCREHGDTYYYINELDIEFEMKNQDIETFYNTNHPYRDRYCDITQHTDEIYDVIEIHKPFLILTACLDGVIRLININDKDYLKKWHNHSLGVKHIIYNPHIDLNGLILSSGFEYFINIYCTDLSIEEAHKGRLEGHNAPVVSCEFLDSSYMCVSVDEDANVRIWDTKLRLCLQMITPNKKNVKVCGLLFMPKLNQFTVYGNKMMYYEPKFIEVDKKETHCTADNTVFPIKVDFNKYYQELYVTTTKDVRVYDKHGEFVKVFKKSTENDHFDNDVRIKCFIFENNYRKFYLGFSNGAVMQYNAGNGSLIKAINESEIEKDGIQTFKYDHSKEISALFYFYQFRKYESNFILITCGLDSLINVYDEHNPEETEKLRVVKGGHTINAKRNEILCMDFSLLMCSLVTGSTNGLVVLWDFEMSKIDDVCYISPSSCKGKSDVMHVKFLEPYPMIFTAYSNGSCALWGVVNNNNRKYLNLLRFQVFYNTIFRVELCSVNCCLFVHKELNDISTRSVLFKKFFCDDEESLRMRSIRAVDELTGELMPEIEVHKDYQYDTVDDEVYPHLYYSKGDMMKYYLYICDNKGYVKIIDVKGVIRKYNIAKESQTYIKSNFNIMKKDNINVETIVNHAIQNEKVLKEYINVYKNEIVVMEWKAHDDGVTDICKIDEPFAVVTVGKDKYMRLWNEQCELIGQINVLGGVGGVNMKNMSFPKDVMWRFKMDEKKILETEIKEVVQVFEDVGVNKIEIGSKEDEEAQMIEVRETTVEEQVEIMKPTEYHKKRFKKVNVEGGRSKRKDNEDDDIGMNNSYEGILVKEAAKHIEEMFHQKGEDMGMGVISDRIINVLSSPTAQQQQDARVDGDVNSGSNVVNANVNVGDVNGQQQQQQQLQHQQRMKPFQHFLMNSKSTSNLSKTKTSFYTTKNAKRRHSNISSALFDPIQSDSAQSKIISTHSIQNANLIQNKTYSKKFFTSTYSSLYKRPKTNKSNSTRTLNSNFRNTLYSERFMKLNEGHKHDLKDRLLLPIINYETKTNERREFKKGETEKLLSYEFYNNSYKNCVRIHPSKGFQNVSMALHYKNMWNYVDAYTKGMSKGEGKFGKLVRCASTNDMGWNSGKNIGSGSKEKKKRRKRNGGGSV